MHLISTVGRLTCALTVTFWRWRLQKNLDIPSSPEKAHLSTDISANRKLAEENFLRLLSRFLLARSKSRKQLSMWHSAKIRLTLDSSLSAKITVKVCYQGDIGPCGVSLIQRKKRENKIKPQRLLLLHASQALKMKSKTKHRANMLRW